MNDVPNLNQFSFWRKDSYTFSKWARRRQSSAEWGALVAGSAGVGNELAAFLSANAPPEVARVLSAFAGSSLFVADLVRRGGIEGSLSANVGPAHDGVAQKVLDVFSEKVFLNGLSGAGVRAVVSEERVDPVVLDPGGGLLVAIDPLDGSSNIDINSSLGTFVSVFDAPAGKFEGSHFLQAGARQRAAAFVLYGPHVDIVFTFGAGVHMATLDPDANRFRMSLTDVRVPGGSNEFAINASNSRHWPDPIRAYIDDCLEGDQGPRGRNLNMRWVGAVVADVYRILIRGGVYLYPQDSREGYENGRLRMLYEAAPIAFLIEQAGGAAIDGFHRILDQTPASLHARTPLIFGSKDKVERVARYYAEGSDAPSAPLFARRGLLRR